MVLFEPRAHLSLQPVNLGQVGGHHCALIEHHTASESTEQKGLLVKQGSG